MSLIITNGQGGFAFLEDRPRSRYNGAFFRAEGKVWKALANFMLPEKVEATTNLLWAVDRNRGYKERFCMPEGINALQYETSKTVEVTVQLDCKEMNDNREWGRKYDVITKDGIILIRFQKRNDPKEPEGEEYDIYIAIIGENISMQMLDRWDPMDCSWDRRRNSPPFQRWVYTPFKLRTKKMAFGFGMTEKEAQQNAQTAWQEWEELQETKKKYVSDLVQKKRIADEDQQTAYQCAITSLYSLLINQEKLMAGLPWFYQNWARDELISAKALKRISPGLAEQVIKRRLKEFEGVPKSHEGTELEAADVPGWLWLRAKEFKAPTKKLKAYLDNIKGLVKTGPKETWMDTTWQGKDTRAGECIEIQALTLGACKAYREMTGKKHPLEAKLKKATIDKFWNGKRLKDKSNDATQRPNIFIAAYAYPELLSKKDWTQAIKHALKELWMPWGGIASISKKHKLFTPHYTGETNQSYHRGDSWYWINNLAAIVMHRTDKKEFEPYIKSIAKASTNEMLYMGASAHHAEVSSATRQTSDGCQAQAWSAAMYIELMDEMHK